MIYRSDFVVLAPPIDKLARLCPGVNGMRQTIQMNIFECCKVWFYHWQSKNIPKLEETNITNYNVCPRRAS